MIDFIIENYYVLYCQNYQNMVHLGFIIHQIILVFISLLQEQKKTSLLIELQQLHQQIDEINSGDAVWDLLQSLEALKVF